LKIFVPCATRCGIGAGAPIGDDRAPHPASSAAATQLPIAERQKPKLFISWGR
jgi:hypothetical protein